MIKNDNDKEHNDQVWLEPQRFAHLGKAATKKVQEALERDMGWDTKVPINQAGVADGHCRKVEMIVARLTTSPS